MTPDVLKMLAESYDTVARAITKLIEGNTDDKQALDEANQKISKLQAQLQESAKEDEAASVALKSITDSFNDLAAKAMAATVDKSKLLPPENSEEDELKTSIEENM